MSSSNPMGNMTEPEYIAFIREIQQGCHAYTPLLSPTYGYVPSLAAGIVFCVLFGIPLLYHTFQFCRVRKSSSILLALGALSTYLHLPDRPVSSRSTSMADTHPPNS